MAKMVLGTVTFERNPSDMTVLTAQRFTATVMTYTTAAFFSWGSSLIGKEIELRWPFMSITQWSDLLSLFEADASLSFNPQDSSSKTYTVQMTAFDGKFHITPSVTDGAGYRKDVVMRFIIMGSS